ncbi:MAG: hypothetical protein HRT52_20810 [Colwellia sp.]|nr:hypothetical protein [Colwellia sp.]
MKTILALTCVLLFSGCCLNQYERNGYSLGLDCFTPSDRTEKKCEVNDPNKSCDEKVEKVKESIEVRIKN